MAPSKTLNLQLRGNVVDLVQHHNWLLIAANHSEGQNLGIQIASIHNLTSRVSAQRWILDTPKSIRMLASTPNIPAEEQFVIDGQELDAGILEAVGQNSNASVIRHVYEDTIQKKSTSEPYVLTKEDKLIILKVCLKLSDKDMKREKTIRTLKYIASIVEDPEACRELKELLDTSHEEYTFGTRFQQGQRIVCVDIEGQGYHVPYIPGESTFDGNTEGLKLVPFSTTDRIELMEPLAHHLVMLVVRREDGSQWVYAYNLDSNRIIFELAAPQTHVVSESETTTDAQFQPEGEKTFVRSITALTTDVLESRFALGFDDGLYLWFDAKKLDADALVFERQELRDTNKEVMTSAQIKEQVNHTGAIIGLAFSNDFQSNKPHLTAFCDDLTTSRIQLRENMPRQIAKASSNAHSKRVRQVVKGAGDHFYTLSKDNTLRMWQTANDTSSSIELRAKWAATAVVPVQNKHGEWSNTHLLVSGHDGKKVSGHSKTDSAVVSFREIEMSNMDPTERTGKVGLSVVRSFYGVWSYALQEVRESPKNREALLEYVGTLNDQLAVDVLMYFVRNEENPVFVGRALEFLNATKHPRLIILFTELMSVDRAATCLQVLEYLRMDHLYGPTSLYPLDLANQSSFLEVRQAALRGFAELATKRGQVSGEENTIFQMAFERVLGIFNDDNEEDMVANAFELLFAQANPLMPGMKGILLTLAHSKYWVQRRGLMLIYLKGMIDASDTKETALDMLRQMRESSNEDLRILSFRLSLFAEEGVQQYLRSLDEVLHAHLNDLEAERRLFLQGDGGDDFAFDATVEQLFLDAVPEENRSDKEVDMDEAQSIVSDLTSLLAATKRSNPMLWSQQLSTVSYCIQTFPMTEDVKQFLLKSRLELEYPAPNLDRELTNAEKILLQEMALSYQPSIASLGAMALAKQGEDSALPILLQLVDDKDDLVKSRAVDGLLAFIQEPIVEHKLRLMVLQASNEQVKSDNQDKAQAIRILVQKSEYRITQSVVTQIVDLIFEDDVYSHSERLAVRYLFESAEVSFTSDARTVLFKTIRDRGERPKLVNIRAKILRALYTKADSEGDVVIQHLLAQTLESPFDDVRMLAVVRLQSRIDRLIESAEDWTTWPRFTAESWSEYVRQYGGGIISSSDVDNLTVQSPVNPLTPLVGVPEPLITEVQLLNRVLFWGGHEALSEWIKTYVKHNLVNADFISTRRFLLTIPIEEVFQFLLQEIDNNVQDTMVRGDETVESWHNEMWMDYLNHPEEERSGWATKFYTTIDATMRTPRNPEEQEEVTKGKVVPPYAPFLKAVFHSQYPSLQLTAFKQITQFFAEEWVGQLIREALGSTDAKLRLEAMSRKSLWVLHSHNLLKDALFEMLKSKHEDLFVRALQVLFHSTDKDIRSWVKGVVDGTAIAILINRIEEVWSEESWVDAGFVHKHFVNTAIFAHIPNPSTSEQNFEQQYFELLRRIFVYETLEDIDSELTVYDADKKELETLLNEGSRIQDQLETDVVSATDAQESWISTVTGRYAATPEKLGAVFTDQEPSVLSLSQALTLLRGELEALQKPLPLQDQRFFDALTLLTIAKGSWADALLKELMSTFDEKLSNEAFNVYFTRGVQGGNAEAFLSSMIVDNHPRLDDVFGMLLSERYGSLRQLKNVLGACSRLNRIDIVFESFTVLAEQGLIETESWDALLKSRHKYLRYRALNYFLTQEDDDQRLQYVSRNYQSTIKEPSPNSISALVSIAEIEEALAQNKTLHELHAFVKNGRSLKFHQLESLRQRFPMSPGFIRKVVSNDTHILAAALSVEAAADLHAACQQLGITLVFSQTNPLYADETQRFWRSNIEICLKHLRDTHWTTNEALASNVLAVDVHLQEHLPSDRDLRSLTLEALGSVAGPENFEQMYTYLDGEYARTVANSLVRSGNVHGLRHLFADDDRTLISMMALGKEANHFVERTIQGALGASVQRKAIQMWLLQLSQEGGAADLLITMLSTSSQAHMLLASQLFGTMYDQATFEHRVIELLKLEKVELTPVPSVVTFHSVAKWKDSMELLREAYVNHYCVEPDPSKPVVLADLRKANTALDVAEQEYKEAVTAHKSDSSETSSSIVDKADEVRKRAKKEVKEVNAQLSKRYMTFDEWKWFAKRMSVNNSRVRYLVASWIADLLHGRRSRKQMLEAQEYIQKICTDNDATLNQFVPFSLNGKEISTDSAVSFGFGSLAGIVRNHRNLPVGLRRKALVSLIQLAEKHPVPTVSAVLSVVFNDPSMQLRRDAFVVALNHQESLGISWDTIIRQASNAVNLRNAERVASGSSDVDILNHLIVSELNRADRQDLLLEMVRTQPHDLGQIALDLLLDVKTIEQATVVTGLTAALQSPNTTIRSTLINRIVSELQEVHAYNQRLLQETSGLDYLNDEPYWDLLVQCLDHGLTSVADASAEYLIQQAKHTDVVLEYVYTQWLNAFEISKQRKACKALERLRPHNATEKLLERVYVNNLTETADLPGIQQTLMSLNQYTSEVSDKLLQAIDATRSTAGYSSNPKDPAFKLAYQVLLRYSGVSVTKTSTPRVGILCELIKILRRNSHHALLGSLLTEVARLPVDTFLSMELDQELAELATTLTHATLLPRRQQALKICISRYLEMTPLLKNLPTSDHQIEPQIDSKWSASGWSILKAALVTNTDFHDREVNRKLYLSDYQKMSSMALIATQGYTHNTFKMVSKVLADKQYTVSERSNALEALVITESIHLLGSLQRLLGMGPNSNQSEEDILTHGGVEPVLYDRALQLVGRYHYTDKRDDIFNYLLERLQNTTNKRQPAVLTSLWRFKDYPDLRQSLLDALLANQVHSSARKVCVDLPNTRDDLTTFHLWFDMVMELYILEFGEEIAPLRAKIAEQAQQVILQELETVDVNRIYQFYLTHCATENLELDVQLWNSKVHMFLSSENRTVLTNRLIEHGQQEMWMELMLKGIQFAKKQKEQDSIRDAMTKTLGNRQRRLEEAPGTDPQLTLEDMGPVQSALDDQFKARQIEVLFEELFAEREELSTEVQEWFIGLYHQNKLGTWFVFTQSQFDEMKPLNWQQEVDAWEVVIGKQVSGMGFYVDLLNQYLDGDAMILESVMDIVRQRAFSTEEQATLLGVVTTIRLEWSVLQREKSKGVRNDDQIVAIEKRWNTALGVVSSIEDVGDELTQILTVPETPLMLKKSALKLYLDREYDLDILEEVYTSYPELKSILAPYMNLEILHKVLMDASFDLREFKVSLEQWTHRLQKVLKDRKDFLDFHWLANHTLALESVDADVLGSFVKATQSSDRETLQKMLAVKSNRSSIHQAAIYSVIADTVQIQAPLSSMYWSTIQQGESLHIVVQHLIANNVLDEQNLDSSIILALSGAESSTVRDAYRNLLPILKKHREWNNLIDRSRGQRYTKELL